MKRNGLFAIRIFVVFLLVSLVGIIPAAAAVNAYSGFPAISIQSVLPDQSVTIVAKNLPAKDSFAVLMNYMGTKGVDGIKVGSFNTGDGASQTLTYNIPADLVGQKQIAIRIQSTSGSGYFAYNWFSNTPNGSYPPGKPPASTGKYPTFSIKAVVRNDSVTIVTSNLPEKDTFSVLMNTMGTQGKNGIKVATLDSGSGGTQTLTYSIPAELHGLKQIAIRLQSTSGSDYFAYNWFYNTTYP